MKIIFKIFIFLVQFICFSLLTPQAILASDRNIFGLHLTQVSDINSAREIINSGGGDWGWVTIVIRPDQLNSQLWQEFFDNCRRYHLIPILRLATIMDNNYWQQPNLSQIDTVANFLNNLNWPVQRRYLILFNEINHASEWGGKIDIKSFTDIAIYTIDKFKSLNPDFYLLSSPLDLAAPEKPPEFKSADNVYREIFLYKPEYFQKIDALASHSYPNHGYIGTPNDTGRHSIFGFQWELNLLKNLGINRTLPVFITETGWPHREGETVNNYFYTTKTAVNFLSQALSLWQKNHQVVAVTPFIYNYPYLPFDHFSWLNSQETLYPEYQKILELPKNKNSPVQITTFEAVNIKLPFLILTNIDYVGQITLKNTGQSIWGEINFCLKPLSSPNVTLDAVCLQNETVYPSLRHTFNFKFRIDSLTPVNSQTFLSWESLPRFSITPFTGNATIYHPQFDFLDQLKSQLQKLWK